MLLGEATLSATDTYSVAIDRLGVYLWVLDSNFCLRFDGTDDCVRIPHSDAIKFSSDDPFTVECWFRSAEVETGGCNYRSIVSTWSGGVDGAVPYPYELRLWLGTCWADGNVSFAVYDSDLFEVCGDSERPSMHAAGPFNDGHWHHFAAVRDGKQAMRILIDGHVAASQTPNPSTGSTYNGRPVTIGGDALGWHAFDGSIDEVRIWNVVCDRLQVRDDMNRRLDGSESGLVGLWNFDEGGGMVAADSTANANHGILVSDPSWVEATWPCSP